MGNKGRDSNIELLRVIAMFLVLIVHSDFFSLGAPSKLDIQNNFLDSSLRVFFQSLSIACVDIFVVISGWFGIRPKVKGLLSYIFQCLFFLIGIYAFCLILGIAELSFDGIRECFAATRLHSLLSPISYWGGLCVILLAIFVLALFYDQLRIYLWNKLWVYIDIKCQKYNIDK